MEPVHNQNTWFHLEQTMFPSESLSVNQTYWTDTKLMVLAIPNQGKMTLLTIAQFPTHICIWLETPPGCGSKPQE